MRPLHIVLVGLPGSGKTTVGRMVAATLAARFVDLDERIAGQERMSVEQIFAERGEAAFRRLETAAMRATLEEEAAVLAPGGGWAAHPGNLEDASHRALTVYLKVTASEAADRVRLSGRIRPLLAGKDMLAGLQELLDRRSPFYQRCRSTLDVTGMPADAACGEVVKLARSLGGW